MEYKYNVYDDIYHLILTGEKLLKSDYLMKSLRKFQLEITLFLII